MDEERMRPVDDIPWFRISSLKASPHRVCENLIRLAPEVLLQLLVLCASSLKHGSTFSSSR